MDEFVFDLRDVWCTFSFLFYFKLLFLYADSVDSDHIVDPDQTPRSVASDLGLHYLPIAAVLCPWARHFTPRKYWLITQEAVAPSRHDWKIVDWDVKPQHKQTNKTICLCPIYGSLGMNGLNTQR